MRSVFSIKRFGFRLIIGLLMIASAALLFNGAQLTRADNTQPNVSVYELNTTSPGIHQISLHAPGTTTPAFVVPGGQYVTPNGQFIMAMSVPGAYQVFNVQTGLQVAGWPASIGKNIPVSMAVSPNGMYAAIASTSTINQNDWSVALFNLATNTQYDFNGTASTSPLPAGTAALQLAPRIEGWTGDESALILSTPVPFSGASTRLFFKMAMTGIDFAPNGTTGSPIPPLTTLGAGQQITNLIFSPDSTRAAILYEDPGNIPINFLPLSDGPGPLPPNALNVIDLASGLVTPIIKAAGGQGLTAPAWAPDGSKLYFGAGPFQKTPYPVNVHLVTYTFSTSSSALGDSLIASDPAHIGVSDMEVCVDQVFMREVSIVPPSSTIPSPSIAAKITSAPLGSLGTHSDVYPTDSNALGPCVPASAASSAPTLASIPTLGSVPTIAIVPTLIVNPTATIPSAPIACILSPQLTIGGMGIVTPGQPNNLRSTPTVGSTLVGQIPANQTFSVLAGPFCDTTSGYVYWKVNYNGIIAYTAEGKTTYLVLPYTAPVNPTATNTPIAIVIIPPSTPTAVPTLFPITLIIPITLPAPVQLSPASGTVFTYYPRTTTLTWLPVSGAASYTVEVQYCPPATSNMCATSTPFVMATGLHSTTYSFNFVGAQPGRWRVWAVGAGNLAGLTSPWWIFRYTQ